MIRSEAQFFSELESKLHNFNTLPILLLWGKHDPALSLSVRDRFLAHFPEAASFELEAGHFWQEDQGIQAAKIIKNWLLP